MTKKRQPSSLAKGRTLSFESLVLDGLAILESGEDDPLSDFADAVHAAAHNRPAKLAAILNNYRAVTDDECRMLHWLNDDSMIRRRGSGNRIPADTKNYRSYAMQCYNDEMATGSSQSDALQKVSRDLGIYKPFMGKGPTRGKGKQERGDSALANWISNPEENGVSLPPAGYRIEQHEHPGSVVYRIVPTVPVDREAAKAKFEKQGLLEFWAKKDRPD